MKRNDTAMSRAAATALVLIALIATVGAVSIVDNAINGSHSSSTSTSSPITTSSTSASNSMSNLVINQKPLTRYITLTWELSPQALQDRFTPFNIVVAQGDTVHITFIVNDSVAHTFTIGPPYNYNMNVSAPGLVNDLTGNTFTQAATNNSPGVVITGTPGNLTGTGSFVAKYAGVFEYYCVYHVQIGMFGYLTVLPNLAYNSTSTTTTTTSTTTNASNPEVSIVYGSAANTTDVYYSPPTITVVIGQNNTVTWINNDIAPHTVTADDGSFNSGNLDAGASWTHVFTTPGTFTYHCAYHPWMRGTIIVKNG